MLPRVSIQVKLSENAMDSIPEAERWFRHSPKSLCESVENYADFCTHYSKTTYAEHLEVCIRTTHSLLCQHSSCARGLTLLVLFS